jgi:hypothetical protein
LLALALAATLALAGAARAEPGPQTVAPPPAAGSSAALKAAVFAEAAEGKGQAMSRVAVDHRFAKSDATAAVGFLCARPDSLDERAASSAYGSDPHGRFLGARLSVAFR